MILPHAKEFLCLLICGSRYVYRSIATLFQHGSWSEYHALHMLGHKLMVEGVTEATSLITAYKFSIVSVNGTKKLRIFQNLFIISLFIEYR